MFLLSTWGGGGGRQDKWGKYRESSDLEHFQILLLCKETGDHWSPVGLPLENDQGYDEGYIQLYYLIKL